jgi:hypothetical protein
VKLFSFLVIFLDCAKVFVGKKWKFSENKIKKLNKVRLYNLKYFCIITSGKIQRILDMWAEVIGAEIAKKVALIGQG